MATLNTLQDLRIIFAGTPDFAAQHLLALLAANCNVVGVFTQPDRPAGRGKKLTASAVKDVALANKLPVFQPEKLREQEDQLLVKNLDADIMIVVAYGLILSKAVLDMPKLGCLNVHGSLLPRWRGAAPIQRAIWAGDQQTGITIMQMDVGLDTGDMLHNIHCDIAEDETSASLYEKLAKLGPVSLIECLNSLLAGHLKPEPQQEDLVTYAHKLSKEEAKIDWQLSDSEIERCIRAFNPWPMSYFVVEQTNIKVWRAHVLTDSRSDLQPGILIQADKTGLYFTTGQGVLCITEVQPAGSKPMPVEALLNSKMAWFTVGTLF